MAQIKDTTPIVDGDSKIAEHEAKLFAKHSTSVDTEERIILTTEARMQEKLARFEEAKPAALSILEEARTTLAVRFRFLDRALWKMPLVPKFDIYGIASDGRCLYFDPIYVIDRFKISFSEVVRDVIHCLFHCIFRHPFMLYSVLRQPWDVACDIAIESIILDLIGEEFPSNMDRRAKESLKVLKAHVGGLVTAERLYWFFSNEGNKVDLKSLAPMFYHDSHGLWYAEDDDRRNEQVRSEGMSSEAQQRETDPAEQSLDTQKLDAIADSPTEIPTEIMQEESEDPNEGQSEDEARLSQEQSEDSANDESDGDGPSSNELEDLKPSELEEKEELAKEWEDISKDIEVELETRLIRMGEGSGSMIAMLKAVNREVGDYAEFLSKFAALHEAMCVNDDEFDYIYYKFGLEKYGNMPLIEPLEYKEDKRIHDFVIAIDTSESCSGEVVQEFMRKTYNILKTSESFHDRVNIHIVQCDAAIQEDTHITSLDQLESYLENFELKGFGGTDFRPVFDYVDILIEKGELTDLRGLIYFTDGEGIYPRKPPDYDTAFIFLDDGYSDPEVPSWAMKELLDIRQLTNR